MLNSIFSHLGYLLLGAGVGGACLFFAVAYALRREARALPEPTLSEAERVTLEKHLAPPAKKRGRSLGSKNKPKGAKKKSVRRRP